jgi:hypothetical protein
VDASIFSGKRNLPLSGAPYSKLKFTLLRICIVPLYILTHYQTGNNMSTEKTEKPARPQTAALMAYNEKVKNGEIVIKKKPSPLSTAFRNMQNDAIAIIEKAIKGDTTVSKAQVDAAWKVVNSIMSTERAEQDKKIRRLEEALKQKQAQDLGAVMPHQDQVKEQRSKEGLVVLEGGHFTYDPKWDEEEEIEEDLDDDNN